MTTITAKPKKARSERRQRSLLIPAIRVTAEEKERIEANAAGHSLTTADFLRRLGQNMTPASTLDRQSVLELLKVAGDLGRMGGFSSCGFEELTRARPPEMLTSAPFAQCLTTCEPLRTYSKQKS